MSEAPGVETVLGPVAPEELGVVLTHEHCLIDLRTYWKAPDDPDLLEQATEDVVLATIGSNRRNPFFNADNLVLESVEGAVEELAAFRTLGGRTVVDLTPPDLGRDPQALQAVARGSGVNIIAGCGHYIQISHPASLAAESTDDIAARFVAELRDGIAGTGIHPGVIGEIGTSNPLHPDEEKVLRAAGRAHRATGVPVAVHTSPAPRGEAWLDHSLLDILESEGVAPHRVLLCHLDNSLEPGESFVPTVKRHAELARRGCYIGYDGCGKDHYFPSSSRASYPSFWCPSDRERAAAAALLLEYGAVDRLLVSHDVCFKIELLRHGGFGYGHILRTFTENLRDYGFTTGDIAGLLVDNPRAFLTPAL